MRQHARRMVVKSTSFISTRPRPEVKFVTRPPASAKRLRIVVVAAGAFRLRLDERDRVMEIFFRLELRFRNPYPVVVGA